MLHSWFRPVTCGCFSVRQYKDHCSSNLTLHKDCKSFSLLHQTHTPPPLLSSSDLHHPQLSPPLLVREYVSTHLFDRSIWPGRWEIRRVTVGLSFDATSNNISEQKLVTPSGRGLDEGSPAELQSFFSRLEVTVSVGNLCKVWAHLVSDS